MYIFCLAMMAESLDGNTIPQMAKTEELKDTVLSILRKKTEEYSTTIEEDEKLLQTDLSLRVKMAIEVRLGEKGILRKAISRVDAWVTLPQSKRLKRK